MDVKEKKKKKEKPWLMESGEYELRIGWIAELDDHTGFKCRFDTVEENEDEGSIFFVKFNLFDERAAWWRMLLGHIVCAANIRIPVAPEDLQGAQFSAEVEVCERAGYEHPIYNFKKLWRCKV